MAKGYANRPSQANLEYVTNSKGEKVRNIAYKGNKNKGKNDISGNIMSDFASSGQNKEEYIDVDNLPSELDNLQDRVVNALKIAELLDDAGLDLVDVLGGRLYRVMGRGKKENILTCLQDLEDEAIYTGNSANFINESSYKELEVYKEKIASGKDKNIKRDPEKVKRIIRDAQRIQPLYDNLDDAGWDIMESYGSRLLFGSFKTNDNSMYEEAYRELEQELRKYGDEHRIDQEEWARIKKKVDDSNR